MNSGMEKKFADDDELRPVPLVKVDRFGFVKPEIKSADVVVKSRSTFENDR